MPRYRIVKGPSVELDDGHVLFDVAGLQERDASLSARHTALVNANVLEVVDPDAPAIPNPPRQARVSVWEDNIPEAADQVVLSDGAGGFYLSDWKNQADAVLSLNPATYGAKFNGVDDDGPAIRAAMLAAVSAPLLGHKMVAIPPNSNVRISTAISPLYSNMTLDFGDGSTVSGAGMADVSYMIDGGGTETATVNLTADALRNDRVLKVAPGSETSLGFQHGDFMRVQASNWLDAGQEEHPGELLPVWVPSGYTLTTAIPDDTSTAKIILSMGQDARESWFPTDGQFVVAIEGEQILIDSMASGDTRVTLTPNVAGRGYNATTATSHAIGAAVTLAPGQISTGLAIDHERYLVADTARVSKLTPLTDFHLRGKATFVGKGAGHQATAIRMTKTLNCSIESLRLRNFDDVAIQRPDWIAGSVRGVRVKGIASRLSTFYGILDNDATCFCTVHDSWFYDVRHATTTSGRPTTGGVPRYNSVVGCYGVGCTAAAFDSHPGGERLTWHDCHAISCTGPGFDLRNPSSTVTAFEVSKCSAGIFARNQTKQATSIKVGRGSIADCKAGIKIFNDVGVTSSLTADVLATRVAPFTATMDDTSLFSDNGTAIVGIGDQAEQMTYVGRSGGLHVTARGVNGTTVQDHFDGDDVQQGVTGFGAVIGSIEVIDVTFKRCTSTNLFISCDDNFNFHTVVVRNVTFHDPVPTSQVVYLHQLDDFTAEGIVVYNVLPDIKAVRVSACNRGSVSGQVRYADATAATIAFSVENGSTRIKVRNPQTSSAATKIGKGVAFDDTCSKCRLIGTEGLHDCVDRYSLGAGFDNTAGTVFDISALSTAIGLDGVALELASDSVTTGRYYPLIGVVARDSDLGANPRKLVAYLTGKASETVSSTTRGGTDFVVGTTPNSPGAGSVPSNEFVFGHDGTLLVPGASVSVAGQAAVLANDAIFAKVDALLNAYRVLRDRGGQIAAGVSSKQILRPDAAVGTTAGSAAQAEFYLDPAMLPDVAGKTKKVRIRITVIANATDPASTFTGTLEAITGDHTGASGSVAPGGFGTVVCSKAVTPPAGSGKSVSDFSADADFPVAGLYALLVQPSPAIATGSTVVVRMAVEARYA